MNKISAIALKKCPKCHKGNMFSYPIFPHIHKFNKMNESCPECGQTFYPELGFYFGAMYFSYALNTAIVLIVFIASQILADLSLAQTLFWVIMPTLLLAPLNFRLSRALMLHLFGGIAYDPKALE